MKTHTAIDSLKHRIARRIHTIATSDCWRRAIDDLERELASHPEDGLLFQAAGLALIEAGRNGEGIAALEAAQLLLPLAPAAELALAEGYLATGAARHSPTLLGHVGMRSDADCDQRLRAARNLARIGGCRAAWTICRRVVQDFPDEAQAWFELTVCMKQLDCPFWQVESAGLRAINLAPHVTRYRVALAMALHEQERSEDAWLLIQRFGAGHIAEVTCPCCVERMQVIFERAGDHDRADQCRDRLEALQESSLAIRNDESESSAGDAT